MSNDEGMPADFDLIKARVRAALDEEETTWAELCATADVSPAEALRAIEFGTYGLPQSIPTLQKLSVALGRGPDWLITGSTGGECNFRESVAERVRRLVWEFVYKAQKPTSHGRILMEYYSRMLDGLKCATPQAAFRRGLPRTWMDIARDYNRVVSKA